MSKFTKEIQDRIDEMRADEIRGVEEGMSLMEQMLSMCGSPLEQSLLFEFKVGFGADVCNSGDKPLRLAGRLLFPGLEFIHVDVFPQYPLPLEGREYVADFLVQISEWRQLKEVIHFGLVVEVDGHDYHERTKEQAKRDKRRDRAMMKAGLYVMRFTGSEVYRDASDVSIEVEQFLIDRAQSLK